jgi:NADH:ubiquinone oxidoreductase subunit D
MEELIGHFKYYSSGLDINPGITYGAVEGPKGEIGVTVVIATSSNLYRLKVRTPVSHNMNIIPSFANGYVFGDFVMTFCSLDIVLGEIDR